MITNLSIGTYGRFGNMLFQVAAVVGIARKSNQTYGFQPLMNKDHSDRFGSTEDCDIEKYFVNPFPRLDRHPHDYYGRAYQWGYHDIYLPQGNWDISGHFQSDKYFLHCIDEVRALLTMKDEPPIRDVVAIHVRRGDYDDAYHPRLGAEYYGLAIKQFPIYSRFEVYSDDIVDAKAMLAPLFPIETPVQYISPKMDYLQSWRLMKRSTNFICGNSSYSLMAAILSDAAGKKVICPRTWFGPAWKPTTADLYPMGSILLSSK